MIFYKTCFVVFVSFIIASHMLIFCTLKWYYDQKITSLFPSDFKSVSAQLLNGKIFEL